MLATLTIVHVAISLVAIVTGFVFLAKILNGRESPVWTQVFLVTTIATSVTGFFFPVHQILPSHIIGLISLAVLTVAVVARKRFREEGTWRKTFIVTSIVSLYLNVFVLVVQMFLKIPALHSFAPTQTEAPFGLAQAVVFIAFVLAGIQAVKRFHPEAKGPLVGATL